MRQISKHVTIIHITIIHITIIHITIILYCHIILPYITIIFAGIHWDATSGRYEKSIVRLDMHHLQEAARHLVVLKKAKLATWCMSFYWLLVWNIFYFP